MRFLIIGAGNAGLCHADFLVRARHDVAIYDSDWSCADALAQKVSARAVTDTTGAYDCAVICTPTATHRELVEAQLEEGRRVVCETPLALTTLDANCLAARCHPDYLFVAESLSPAAPPLRERLQRGDFGWPLHWRINIVSLERHPEWVSDLAVGGGFFLDGGVHFATLARLLFGCSPISHFGSMAHFGGGQDDAADTGVMVVDYNEGHQLVLQIANGVATEKMPRNSFVLVGPQRTENFMPQPDLRGMWKNLIGCLEGRVAPLVSLEEAAGGVSDIWSCYNSFSCTHPDCSY